MVLGESPRCLQNLSSNLQDPGVDEMQKKQQAKSSITKWAQCGYHSYPNTNTSKCPSYF